jgi:hypothetical protein
MTAIAAGEFLKGMCLWLHIVQWSFCALIISGKAYIFIEDML